jgi:hypothetical protein
MGLSQHVPDRQKWRRISTGQAPLFGKTGQPSACIPIKHPMTKSDMEREKEGRMTRKFLMTVRSLLSRSPRRLASVLPRPTALAEVLAAADSTAAGLAAVVFTADMGVVFTAGMAAAFTAGMVAIYPGYYGYGYSPYYYYCY